MCILFEASTEAIEALDAVLETLAVVSEISTVVFSLKHWSLCLKIHFIF